MSVRSKDEPVMLVLDWLMDNSRSGLLNLELELTQKVPEAGSWSDTEVDAGHFGVRATLKEGQTHAEVEKLLLGVVAKLKKGEFSQEDVDAIKLHEDIREKQTLESNWGRVSRMMDSFISRRSWQEMLERDQRLDKVKKADVVRVANQYLNDNFVVVYRKQGKQELPKIQKPGITPVDIDSSRKSAFHSEISAMETRELEPEWLVEGKHYMHTTLPAGQMISALNQRNDLFSLEYRFDRGHRRERTLCFALELLERAGAGDIPAEALQKQLYALGTSISFTCNSDESSIRLRGIDANLEKSVKLLDEWFHNPTFDNETLAKLKENTLSTRQDQMDDSEMLGRALGGYAKYGKNSAWLTHPSNGQVERASSKALTNLLTRFPDHEHRTLYFGPRAAADASKVVGLRPQQEEVLDEAHRVRVRDVLDVVTEAFQRGRHLLDAGAIDAVVVHAVGAVDDDAHAQRAVEWVGHVPDRWEARTGQVLLGAVHERGGVAHAARHDAVDGDVDRDDLRQRLLGDPPHRRLQADEAAAAGGDADRPAAVVGVSDRNHACGHERSGAAGRSARRVRQAPRVAGDAGERCLGGGGEPELGRGRQPERHEPGRLELVDGG